MRRLPQRCVLMLMLILLCGSAGCTLYDQAILTVRPENEALRSKTLTMLEQAHANLVRVGKLGYDTHLTDFVTANNYFQEAVAYLPSFAAEHPYAIPYLKVIPDEDTGDMKVVEADQQPRQQKRDNVRQAYPLALKSQKTAQQLLQDVTAARLEDIFYNLEFIWTINRQRSVRYASAHNAFLESRKRLPSLTVPTVSENLQYANRFVRFDPDTRRLIALDRVVLNPADDYPAAVEYIDNGYEVSQKILAQYYLEEVVSEAQKTKQRVDAVVQRDPDNAIKEFTIRLEDDLEYAEQVQDDPSLIRIDRITQTYRARRDAEFNLKAQQNLNRTLEFDIFFEKGQYELATLDTNWERVIQTFVDGLVTTINDYTEAFPGHSVTIKIKTVGYTDQLGFREGTPLIAELTEGLAEPVPRRQPARRKFLNTRLALFRAKAINKAIQQRVLLSETLHQEARVNIVSAMEGKGERVPLGVDAPYPENDPRRRICRVSSILWSP
jgi:hypothetical protein